MHENTSTLETGYIQCDTRGRAVSIRYKKGSGAYETFYYMYNQQGHVTALLDPNGLAVVNYIHSVAGELWGCYGSRGADLATFNPLHYRGYIYDDETGFYYLQSRYYDPVWLRFISADSILGRVGGILEYNLYEYCGNDPVNKSDPTGHSWFDALKKAIVVAVQAAVAAIRKASAKVGSTLKTSSNSLKISQFAKAKREG